MKNMKIGTAMWVCLLLSFFFGDEAVYTIVDEVEQFLHQNEANRSVERIPVVYVFSS